MKLLALLLITLNITFFLWQYHSGAFSLKRSDAIDTVIEGQQILLVSELNEAMETRSFQSKFWCGAEMAVKQSIRNVLFVSDFGIVPSSSAARPGMLLAEWLDTHQKPILRPKKAPAITTTVSDDKSTHLAQAKLESKKALISHESQNRESKEAELVKTKAKSNASVEPIKKREITPKSVDESARMCYEAGPFATMQQFYSWRKRTGIDAASIKPVSREEQKINDYMVYLPAGETYEQSLANVELLKQKGITDYWLFPKGEAKGDISLGVFSTDIRAETFKKQLAAKNLNALIKPRYKKAQRIYAHVHIKQEYEDKLIISRDQWQKSHPEFAIKVNDGCVF